MLAPVRSAARSFRRLWRRESRRASRERLRWAVRVRGTVLVLFLALAVGAWATGVFPSLAPLLAGAVMGTIMNLVAAHRVARWERIPGMLLWTGVGDSSIITYVVVATGGTGSPFLFLYVVQVLTTALVVDVVLGAMVGMMSLVLLTTAVVGPAPLAGHFGLEVGVRPDHLVWLVSLGLTLLFLVFLGGHLTRRLGRSERQLAGTHRRLSRSMHRLTETHAALQDAYRRLAVAEAELIETDRMKTLQLLVAGVAHELGNPLTVLVGNVEPLGEAWATYERVIAACVAFADTATSDAAAQLRVVLAATAEVRRETPPLLANCAEATRRAVGLLGQLRDFGRGGRGTVRRLAPLVPGLIGTLALVRYRLPPRVTVHESYADVPDVVCVPAELNQVFINLLMNAIDVLVPGGHLWLALDRDGHEARVTVRDDGPGIAPDLLPHIFEPFITTKEAGQGTGLGLAISHAIVLRHGGRIEADIAAEGGAVFTVWLPLPTVPPDKASDPRLEPPGA